MELDVQKVLSFFGKTDSVQKYKSICPIDLRRCIEWAYGKEEAKKHDVRAEAEAFISLFMVKDPTSVKRYFMKDAPEGTVQVVEVQNEAKAAVPKEKKAEVQKVVEPPKSEMNLMAEELEGRSKRIDTLIDRCNKVLEVRDSIPAGDIPTDFLGESEIDTEVKAA